MTNAYIPPGVTVAESITPSISPLIGTSADICLVGTASTATVPGSTISPLTTTDIVILSGTAPHVLPTLQQLNNNAQLIAVQSVTDVLNPSVGSPLGAGYTVTTDYTVATGSGPPASNGTITRVSAGTIPDGRLVAVTYTYVPSDYWNPIRLSDIGSVEARFGPAWLTAQSPTTGQTVYTGINSELSMAARCAFENGAGSVICAPLFTLDGSNNQIAPNATQVGNPATWTNTLNNLKPITDLNVIVPVVGQDGVNISDAAMLSIFGAFQSYQAYMNSQQQYVVAIFGEDGTPSTPQGVATLATTMRNTHAPNLQGNFGNALSTQAVLLNNTVYQRATPSGTGTVVQVGGQYAAAAFAGALAGRTVSASMTRQPLLGFQGISDFRTQSDKNADAAAGLCVIEQIGNQFIRCRQANTLDISEGPARAELSVVRAKFLMVESIKATIDNQIIGTIIADANSPLVVRSAISGVLAVLQESRVIVAYDNVTAALTSLNPTTITASFSYSPAFPVNYVNITFALDLTNGTINVVNQSGTSA